MIEQEIKLRFESVEAARLAVVTAGGRLTHSRRLLDDQLYDAADGSIRNSGAAVRVRREERACYLTFKGPVQPGIYKARDEWETSIGDADTIASILEGLGLRPWFRAQKYREEYAIGNASITIDEAPIGVFVEIEGSSKTIDDVAEALGCTRGDYINESYRRLYVEWCQANRIDAGDMLFR